MQGTTNISAAARRHDEAKVQGGHRGNGLSKVPGAYAGRSVQVKLLMQRTELGCCSGRMSSLAYPSIQYKFREAPICLLST